MPFRIDHPAELEHSQQRLADQAMDFGSLPVAGRHDSGEDPFNAGDMSRGRGWDGDLLGVEVGVVELPWIVDPLRLGPTTTGRTSTMTTTQELTIQGLAEMDLLRILVSKLLGEIAGV